MAPVLDDTKCWQQYEELEHSYISAESVKQYNHSGNTIWPRDSSSGYFPKRNKKACPQKQTKPCERMITGNLLRIGPNQKQHKSVSQITIRD